MSCSDVCCGLLKFFARAVVPAKAVDGKAISLICSWSDESIDFVRHSPSRHWRPELSYLITLARSNSDGLSSPAGLLAAAALFASVEHSQVALSSLLHAYTGCLKAVDAQLGLYSACAEAAALCAAEAPGDMALDNMLVPLTRARPVSPKLEVCKALHACRCAIRDSLQAELVIWQAQGIHIEACTAAASPTQWSQGKPLETIALDRAAPVTVSLVASCARNEGQHCCHCLGAQCGLNRPPSQAESISAQRW